MVRKEKKSEEQEAIDREIDSAMQKALTYQSKIMGSFYRGIMTSLRVTEEMIRRYAEARGGLKKEFAAAELEIIKEIEHAFVKLQRLRVQHDAWLEAQKVMERLQRGAARPAAAPPKPAAPAGLSTRRTERRKTAHTKTSRSATKTHCACTKTTICSTKTRRPHNAAPTKTRSSSREKGRKAKTSPTPSAATRNETLYYLILPRQKGGRQKERRGEVRSHRLTAPFLRCGLTDKKRIAAPGRTKGPRMSRSP